MTEEIFEAINDQQWYVLIAPDGCIQTGTLAPSLELFYAFIKTLSLFGVSQSLTNLLNQGYRIKRVRLSINAIYEDTTPNG